MGDAFVLPSDVDLVANHEVLTIRYPGDAVIENDLGMDSFDVEVEGDLTVRLDRVSGNFRSGGTLTIEGQIDGGSLHGREILLGESEVRCRAIEATDRILIGAAGLTVDVIIAPEIRIDSSAHGRVTVIESRNERGPTKIKGGFSLAEYEELLGNAESFLAERGLSPLGEGPEIQAPAPKKKRGGGKKKKQEEEQEPPPLLDEEEDDIDDPLSLSSDDLPLVEVELEPVQTDEFDPELFEALQDAVGRIVGCYAEDDLPPPVVQLQDLVASRDHEALRADITTVWNGLLAYHQKKGIRPHHQVTHAFNVIHGLLQPA